MRRRDLIAGLGGVGIAATGGWVALSNLRHGRGNRVDPVAVESIDAPGSEAGRMRVPVEGSVTVVDLFATWCAPCEEQVDELRAARERADAAARFVSVTNEAMGRTFTRADLREWWRAHGGRWTVALDPEGTLTRELGASGLPFLAVVDSDRTIRWTHHGVASADEVIERVRSAGR